MPVVTPIERLLVISHVCHYRHDGALYAYAPYARELDIWADLFPRILIAAPCRDEPPPGDTVAFTRSNVSMLRQLETGGENLGAKLAQVFLLPVHVWSLCLAMRRVDAIHVRCPGNLGLLGVLLAPLFSRYLIAKYAGQWSDYPGVPFTWRLQRRLLASSWWHGPVTVYGRGSDDPPHVISFFTSVMTSEQVRRAGSVARSRNGPARPLRVLSVGRLSEAKNVHVLISALDDLRAQGVAAECVIVGDGPDYSRLESQVEALHLSDRVTFAGGVTFDRVLEYYERADVLVLASETEGWPKALTEAMAFGLVCIGSNRGLMPEMLSHDRGFVVPPGDRESLARALAEIAAGTKIEGMGLRASEWAQQHSIDGLKRALGELMASSWGVRVPSVLGAALPQADSKS